jgi:hypothetical protein
VTRIGELGTLLTATSDRSTILHGVLWLLVTANVAGSQILVTLMMVALRSSKMSVRTRATRRTIPEDGILTNSVELSTAREATTCAATR